MKQKFQLRYAAGLYWLLDMEQKGPDYIKPIAVNEVGAYIWSMLQEKTKDEVIQALGDKYGIPVDEAKRDIEEFLEQIDCRLKMK